MQNQIKIVMMLSREKLILELLLERSVLVTGVKDVERVEHKKKLILVKGIAAEN